MTWTLPDDYARCEGKTAEPECEHCARRHPVSERAYRVVMIVPAEAPCPNRIAGPEQKIEA